ncbi:MAG: DUF4377 domain-containing protein [Anaerolineae bacterium]
MIHRTQTILITLLTALMLVGIVSAQDTDDDNERLLHIGPYTQECVGVAPQDCLVVRFEDEDALSLFYDNIEGFTFEEGFEYILRVAVDEREDVPADASSLTYTLIEIEQQLPASLEGKVWELQTLYEIEVEETDRYTLVFSSEEEAGMRADCNSVVAEWERDPFSITTTISTMALCPEDSLDTDYLTALESATLFTVENGELILQTPDGQLRFAPPAIDAESDWYLQTALGMAMTLQFEDESPYNLSFDGDEQAFFTLPCERLEVAIERTGAVLQLEIVDSEALDCEEGLLPSAIADYPPEKTVYAITVDGLLVLEDENSNYYAFARAED